VIVKLEKPRAVSVFLFEYPVRMEGDDKMFIEEFELEYISPLDSSRTFRTFATVSFFMQHFVLRIHLFRDISNMTLYKTVHTLCRTVLFH